MNKICMSLVLILSSTFGFSQFSSQDRAKAGVKVDNRDTSRIPFRRVTVSQREANAAKRIESAYKKGLEYEKKHYDSIVQDAQRIEGQTSRYQAEQQNINNQYDDALLRLNNLSTEKKGGFLWLGKKKVAKKGVDPYEFSSAQRAFEDAQSRQRNFEKDYKKLLKDEKALTQKEVRYNQTMQSHEAKLKKTEQEYERDNKKYGFSAQNRSKIVDVELESMKTKFQSQIKYSNLMNDIRDVKFGQLSLESKEAQVGQKIQNTLLQSAIKSQFKTPSFCSQVKEAQRAGSCGGFGSVSEGANAGSNQNQRHGQ